MTRLIDDNLKALEALCKRYHVERLDVFGSASGDDFSAASSDLDFLVRFERDSTGDPAAPVDRYFGLLEALRNLFGREIDLVEESAMRNPYFIRRVNESRSNVYAA